MDRREFIATAGSAAVARAGAAKPNILLLYSDQHNAGVLGSERHPDVRTPHLDRLAADGVRFTRAYCQDGVCMPSRTALMTGQYCRTLGLFDNSDKVAHPERLTTLVRVLRENGYRTAAFGKRHLARPLDGDWDTSATDLLQTQEASNESYRDWVREQGQEDNFLQDYSAEFGNRMPGRPAAPMASRISALPPQFTWEGYVTRKTIELLRESKKRGKPFFCWCSFYHPHQPYTPQKHWADLYPPEKIHLPQSLREPLANLPPVFRQWRTNPKIPWCLGRAALDVNLYRMYISYYYALVAEIDDYIGTILKTLEAEGLAQNTIVLYTADHGDFAGTHGMIEKCVTGHNVYESTLRVPLIARWSGHFRRGYVSRDLVESVDLFPTLLELAGIPMPKDYTPPGRSLVPVLEKGSPLERRFAVSENRLQVAVIGQRYKLGAWLQAQREGYGDMLFDRETDPLEIGNLFGRPEAAEAEKEAREFLEQWAARTPVPVA